MLINGFSPKDLADETLQQLYKAGLPADHDDMGFAWDRACHILGIEFDDDQLNRESGADYDFFNAAVEAFNQIISDVKKAP